MSDIIEKLSYVRLGVDDLELSAEFAARIVGLQRVEAAEGLALFRSDFRDHSLALFARSADEPEQAVGLELRDEAALEALLERLRAAGFKPSRGTAQGAELRRCRAYGGLRLRGGVALEFVVRPLSSGWRYHGPRDAGILGFGGVVLASTDVVADIALWTEVLGGAVADYIGDGAYIALDGAHHRVTILPSSRDALLEMQFEVEGMDQVMQAGYFLQSHQVSVASGPGRNPASGELFLSYRGPDGMLFGYVAEGQAREAGAVARQFAFAPGSFCSWGSTSSVPEYGGAG